MPGPSPTPTFNGPRIILSLRPVQPGPSPVPTFNQTTSPSDTVQEVGVAQDLRRASASGSFACGLRTDGTARCWGVTDSGLFTAGEITPLDNWDRLSPEPNYRGLSIPCG